ncbi:MAG TPA: FAD-binding protein [Propionibacteriaceae bacterium]|nr:FAD-binding protein [Propionibacteriaceae bacterium]
MQISTIRVGDEDVPVVTANTVVVGTGAAGYCAADRLVQFGQDDVVMVTDKVRAGASRNAGSDKQTYYKLTLSGDDDDSVRAMARTLFSGGAMDGDNAVAEAALSARCFYHLVEAGVPFPSNRLGEFVGYKTDHDPRQRATSVGPFTSKSMVEALEDRVRGHGTPVFDACRIVDLVVADGRVAGLLCLRTDVRAAASPRPDDDEGPETNRTDLPRPGVASNQLLPATGSRFLLVRCRSIVYASGGPAGMYADAVYPHGQWGANGAALRAGVHGKNLTEWQFGLASIKPRWNVSGTYMQAVPRFVSTAEDGSGEREFLAEALPDYGDLITRIFLKGYQWPFDVRKARDGSSLIDLLVHRETVLRGRRVFLDFRSNPLGTPFDPAALGTEAREYLERAGVVAMHEARGGHSTPIQRLQHMNRPAYDFYLNRNPGVDLETDLLEVAVCAQHNNGGLVVDAWWQSNIEGFFPVGEAAGSHGVYRPGGAALNSGQVGATRAAEFIAARRREGPGPEEEFRAAASPVVAAAQALLHEATSRAESASDTTDAMLRDCTRLMSYRAAFVRSEGGVRAARDEVARRLAAYSADVVADPASRRSVNRLFLIRDILTSQYVYLEAMLDYLAHDGGSRGAVLYTDPAGVLPVSPDGTELDLPADYRHRLDAGRLDDVVQETWWDGGGSPRFVWRPVRPLPPVDEVFETVWREFRDGGAVR